MKCWMVFGTMEPGFGELTGFYKKAGSDSICQLDNRQTLPHKLECALHHFDQHQKVWDPAVRWVRFYEGDHLRDVNLEDHFTGGPTFCLKGDHEKPKA